jgi:hypothetical protein
MSSTSARSQGVYETANPICLSMKASLAGFQWMEFGSGDVATPLSPIPPARASGAIIRKGTAVVMVLIWPRSESLNELAASERPARTRHKENNTRYLPLK